MPRTEIHDYDDQARVVVIRSDDGTVTTRPYNAEENAAADARATAVTNEQTLDSGARGSISTLLTSVNTLKTIIAKTNAEIGPADTKDVARETLRVLRQ